MSASVSLQRPNESPSQKLRLNLAVFWQEWRQELRTHHYQISSLGLDFALEANTENPKEFFMTAQNAGVKEGDLIRIYDDSSYLCYKVLEIERYIDLAGMWMAKLAIQ